MVEGGVADASVTVCERFTFLLLYTSTLLSDCGTDLKDQGNLQKTPYKSIYNIRRIKQCLLMKRMKLVLFCIHGQRICIQKPVTQLADGLILPERFRVYQLISSHKPKITMMVGLFKKLPV
jgi:hypothetical protein